jgi:hypothetical protein
LILPTRRANMIGKIWKPLLDTQFLHFTMNQRPVGLP